MYLYIYQSVYSKANCVALVSFKRCSLFPCFSFRGVQMFALALVFFSRKHTRADIVIGITMGVLNFLSWQCMSHHSAPSYGSYNVFDDFTVLHHCLVIDSDLCGGHSRSSAIFVIMQRCSGSVCVCAISPNAVRSLLVHVCVHVSFCSVTFFRPNKTYYCYFICVMAFLPALAPISIHSMRFTGCITPC